MNASQISAGLAAIVATITNTLFLRATDSDANTDADNIDLAGKVIVIYNNLPQVGQTLSVSGFTQRTWPVEIRVLKLADFDDDTVQGDLLRDACISVADAIFDKLETQFPDQRPPILEYGLNLLGEVKVFDKTLTGVRLTFTLTLDRTVYYCP